MRDVVDCAAVFAVGSMALYATSYVADVVSLDTGLPPGTGESMMTGLIGLSVMSGAAYALQLLRGLWPVLCGIVWAIACMPLYRWGQQEGLDGIAWLAWAAQPWLLASLGVLIVMGGYALNWRRHRTVFPAEQQQ
ncbi:MAG: hypothetical protein QM639_00910 [Rhodocyclaceae bacterium]